KVESVNEEGQEQTVRKPLVYLPATQFQARRFSVANTDFYYSLLSQVDVTEQICYELQFINSQGKPDCPREHYAFVYHYLICQTGIDKILDKKAIKHKSNAIPGGIEATNITVPTAVRSAVLDEDWHWRIISWLALTPAMLSVSGVIKRV